MTARLLHICARRDAGLGKPLQSQGFFSVAGGRSTPVRNRHGRRGVAGQAVLPFPNHKARTRGAFASRTGPLEDAPIPLWGATEAGMQILLIAAATLVVVWIVVLWGSRFFGPR